MLTDTSQLLAVPGVKQPRVALVVEPVAIVRVANAAARITRHLDTLQDAEFPYAVAAYPEGHERGHDGDGSKAPIGLFYEVLEVHAVQTCDERAHGETQSTDAVFQLQQHEGVAVGIENGTDAAR